MPKMKTHRGAAKRFHFSGSGKLMHYHSMRRHMLLGKTTQRKKHPGRAEVFSPRDQQRVRKLFPYA